MVTGEGPMGKAHMYTDCAGTRSPYLVEIETSEGPS